MNIADLLVLATARNVNFDYISGGRANLTSDDVMYALASVKHEGAELLLRVKYTHDNTFLKDLERKVWFQAIGLSKQEGWPAPNGHIGQRFLRDLARLALLEHINPHVCLRCGGVGKKLCTTEMLNTFYKHGVAVNEGQILECTHCRGTGKRRPTEHVRAQSIGLHHEIWKRQWSIPYEVLQSLLMEWEDIGIRKATSRLRA